MLVADLTDKVADTICVSDFVDEIGTIWPSVYRLLDSQDLLWVIVPPTDEIPYAPMVAAEQIRSEAPFVLKNTVIRHTSGTPGYETFLLFVKDPDDYRFRKDAIRVPHIRREWGDRETTKSGYHGKQVTRYNPQGRDPGNVWLIEDRDVTQGPSVDKCRPFGEQEAIRRCVKSGSIEGDDIGLLCVSEEVHNVVQEVGRVPNRISWSELSTTATRTGAGFEPPCPTTPDRRPPNSPDIDMGDLTVYFDSSESMPEVEDCSVDAILTSPPYWDIKNYGHENEIGHTAQGYRDYHARLNAVWKACLDVLRPGGCMWVVADTFLLEGDVVCLPYHIALGAESVGFGCSDIGIWYKPTAIAGMEDRNVVNKHEYLLRFVKPPVDRGGEGWGEVCRHPVNRGPAGGDVLHQAAFPVGLAEYLLDTVVDRGGTVLDPFFGSGTTGKVAIDGGCECIGYEINPDFDNVIRDRIGFPEEGQQTFGDY